MNFAIILLISFVSSILTLNETNQTCAKYNYAHIGDTINQHCCSKAVVIDSLMHPYGYLQINFTHPSYFDPLLNCIYHFYGKPNERVQLFIEYFNLVDSSNPLSYPRTDCQSIDSICINFNKKNSSSNETYFKNLCLCGDTNLISKQILSSISYMMLNFKVKTRKYHYMNEKNQFSIGYRIFFKFVQAYNLVDLAPNDLNLNAKINQEADSCRIIFNSSISKVGYFNSPNYLSPGYYPRDIECSYYFYGAKHERIKITFISFDIEGVPKCDTNSKSDILEISHFENRDRVFQQYCGLNNPGTQISYNNFLRVTLRTNDIHDAKGFQSFYQFI